VVIIVGVPSLGCLSFMRSIASLSIIARVYQVARVVLTYCGGHSGSKRKVLLLVMGHCI